MISKLIEKSIPLNLLGDGWRGAVDAPGATTHEIHAALCHYSGRNLLSLEALKLILNGTPPPAPTHTPANGPGAELSRILAGMGIHPSSDCGCKKIARKMNRRGAAWCRENIDWVLDRLKEESDKRKSWIFSRIVAKRIVFMAIRRAEGGGTPPLENFFERVYCVNLKRRPDRLARVRANMEEVRWPFARPQFINAIDGKNVPHPSWWGAGGGGWGCFRSHLRLIEECLNEGVESVLLLEDDALFPLDFTDRVTEFLAAVPDDWGMLYLGGQHLRVNARPPRVVVPGVYQPYNVNRTHAFALRGDTMRAVYKHLTQADWNKGDHIDHHLGRFHQQRNHPIYCPGKWLVGQAEGKSNISGKTPDDRMWAGAADYARAAPRDDVFIAVVGLHSSGSSCTAGVLHHLGVHMGNKLTGYYGNNPEKNCGFEASGLVSVCQRAARFPNPRITQEAGHLRQALSTWIANRRGEAGDRGTVAGGKYPTLCAMGDHLMDICGDKLRVVHIDRPLEESITSLKKRQDLGWARPNKLEAVQRWLHEEKTRFLGAVPAEHQITVNYHDLIGAPRREVERLLDFIPIEPSERQVDRAVDYIDPKRRHVKL